MTDTTTASDKARAMIAVLTDFDARICPIIGRLVGAVGKGDDARTALVRSVADGVATAARDVVTEHAVSGMEWTTTDFAKTAADILGRFVEGPAFHFGPIATKELELANAADLIEQILEIEMLGTDADIRGIMMSEGFHQQRLEARQRRHRVILEGGRPFSGGTAAERAGRLPHRHCEAPWSMEVALRPGMCEGDEPETVVTIAPEGQEDQFRICTVVDEAGTDDNGEGRVLAHGRLIKASPKMLEVLERVVALPDSPDAWREDAEAVIAEALSDAE